MVPRVDLGTDIKGGNMAKTISPKFRERIIIAEFALPAIIILTVLVFFPIVKTVIMSFQEWQLTSPSADHPFVGLDNYRDVVTLSHFPLHSYILFSVSQERWLSDFL